MKSSCSFLASTGGRPPASASKQQNLQLDLERTMERCTLEFEPKLTHDVDDCGSCLNHGSKVGYVLLSILLLELDFL